MSNIMYAIEYNTYRSSAWSTIIYDPSACSAEYCPCKHGAQTCVKVFLLFAMISYSVYYTRRHQLVSRETLIVPEEYSMPNSL